MDEIPHISIVSPVYRAEKTLNELVVRICQTVSQITPDFEIILVDDSGPDKSWSIIEELSKTNSCVKGIKLSRNFGQHYAITAGLDRAKGDWIVVLDCDLQDQPEEILKLYKKAQEGYDVVLASRFARQDSFLKKLTSVIFYRTLGYLTGSKHDETIANFGIYSHKVIQSIVSMRESIRFFPSMVKWVGFSTTKINIEHAARADGKSNYNLKRLLNLALDIMLAFSDKPIRLVFKSGILITLFGILFSLITLYKWYNNHIFELGYTSLIISIWLLSGVIISTLGIVGLYIGKIFEGVKNRPIYIIDKTTNL
ncbi:MAG TPA: glycosyltransferase [Flavobacterium sp.]|nr:glycosyltransferase [Flavobacterium sp.]